MDQLAIFSSVGFVIVAATLFRLWRADWYVQRGAQQRDDIGRWCLYRTALESFSCNVLLASAAVVLVLRPMAWGVVVRWLVLASVLRFVSPLLALRVCGRLQPCRECAFVLAVAGRVIQIGRAHV